eukprot:CAMPEP_0119282422 /NCGR_PEP_ID=MMETSP1329-20130426/26701_1 /TAXON_ID=114041 /ORGANISM="Genus nov. species nov., Strain RCC1024" /LENGTH=48 /DNA_ID= /DNA_START= /DNA_END= /DNA_ORIENTATION=
MSRAAASGRAATPPAHALLGPIPTAGAPAEDASRETENGSADSQQTAP